jgi:hypothetical protein
MYKQKLEPVLSTEEWLDINGFCVDGCNVA